MIVDSHCHAAAFWHEPYETLLHAMDLNGVEHGIIMNMHGFGDVNNAYQQEAVRRHPDRLSSCVCVDEHAPDAPQTLERLAEAGACGVRILAKERSPGDDPLAIWRTAARLGLAASVCKVRGHKDTALAIELAEALPNLRMVIEHAHSMHGATDPTLSPAQWLAPLARYSNVYIKIGGLGEFAKRANPITAPFPYEKPIKPYFEELYALFGASRIMWGSDFPTVSAREGYTSALQLVRAEFAGKPKSEQNLVFGEVAANVFRVKK